MNRQFSNFRAPSLNHLAPLPDSFNVSEIITQFEMSRDMTKPTKWVCAQRKLRSAWASAQSDQSLRCALIGKLRTQGFFMRIAKTLIRLGGSNYDVIHILSNQHDIVQSTNAQWSYKMFAFSNIKSKLKQCFQWKTMYSQLYFILEAYLRDEVRHTQTL